MNNRQKSRAELLAVLEEFHIPISFFDGLRRSSLEKHIASHSPQKLKDFYLILLEPGIDDAKIAAWCPVWPAGHQRAGTQPKRDVLRKIRARLVAAQKETEEIEYRKLVLREKQVRLQQTRMALEKG